MTRTPRLVLALVLLLALALGCSGSSGDRVAVVGDSITSLDQNEIQTQIGADHEVEVTGNFGDTIAQSMPGAEVVASNDYDQVIINLGTNDVIGRLPIDQSMSSLQQMIALFPTAKCVHLVDINEHMIDLRDGSSLTEQATAFNAALQDLADSEGRLSIIDWSSVTADTLNDKSPATSTLTKDSIHPTPEGYTKLLDLYQKALDSCGGVL